VERLQASLGETVPDAMTVLLTVTAPIRLPSKTADALEVKIQTLLGRGARSSAENDTIHGNRVRTRLLRCESQQAPRLIGFVHNSDSDALLLLDMTSELFQVMSAEAGRRAFCGRSMAGVDKSRRGFIFRGLSLYLFAASHSRRLSEDPHG
jgi:hypothetical protein